MRSSYNVSVNYLSPVLEQMKTQRSGAVAHKGHLGAAQGYNMTMGIWRLVFA
jgi:hypothetical protein